MKRAKRTAMWTVSFDDVWSVEYGTSFLGTWIMSWRNP